MQYVTIKFRPLDAKTYTYHFDGPPVAPGDRVKVPSRDGDGWQGVHVVAVSDEKPPHPTKPILGIIPKEPT